MNIRPSILIRDIKTTFNFTSEKRFFSYTKTEGNAAVIYPKDSGFIFSTIISREHTKPRLVSVFLNMIADHINVSVGSEEDVIHSLLRFVSSPRAIEHLLSETANIALPTEAAPKGYRHAWYSSRQEKMDCSVFYYRLPISVLMYENITSEPVIVTSLSIDCAPPEFGDAVYLGLVSKDGYSHTCIKPEMPEVPEMSEMSEVPEIPEIPEIPAACIHDEHKDTEVSTHEIPETPGVPEIPPREYIQHVPVISDNANEFRSMICEFMKNGFSVTPGTMYVTYQSFARTPIGYKEESKASEGVIAYREKQYYFVQMEQKVVVDQ